MKSKGIALSTTKYAEKSGISLSFGESSIVATTK